MKLPHSTDVRSAASTVLEGGIVAVPTKRWYMLAVLADSAMDCERLFKIKGRPRQNPLLFNVHDTFEFREWFHVTDCAQLLMNEFWPGDLAIRVSWLRTNYRLQDDFGSPALLGNASGTMGQLANYVGKPLAVTSANLSAPDTPGPSATPHELDRFAADSNVPIRAWVDGGTCLQRQHLTIVDASKEVARVERRGTTCLQTLSRLLRAKLDLTGLPRST